MVPPPKSSEGRKELEFPGNAWQPGLGGAEAAAALSESRKAFEARAEGCPLWLFLAPPGLPLRSPRPGRGRCPPRGIVPWAPALHPRPTAGGSRAACRVRKVGRATPRRSRSPPGPSRSLLRPGLPKRPVLPRECPRAPVAAHLAGSRGASRCLVTPAPSAFPGHVARRPAGIPASAPWRRGGRAAREGEAWERTAAPEVDVEATLMWTWGEGTRALLLFTRAHTHTSEG